MVQTLFISYGKSHYISLNKKPHECRVWVQKIRDLRERRAVALYSSAPSGSPNDTCGTPWLRG